MLSSGSAMSKRGKLSGAAPKQPQTLVRTQGVDLDKDRSRKRKETAFSLAFAGLIHQVLSVATIIMPEPLLRGYHPILAWPLRGNQTFEVVAEKALKVFLPRGHGRKLTAYFGAIWNEGRAGYINLMVAIRTYLGIIQHYCGDQPAGGWVNLIFGDAGEAKCMVVFRDLITLKLERNMVQDVFMKPDRVGLHVYLRAKE